MTGFADARRIEALIEGIDRFNATPGRGTTRLTYSPEYRAARDFVALDSSLRLFRRSEPMSPDHVGH